MTTRILHLVIIVVLGIVLLPAAKAQVGFSQQMLQPLTPLPGSELHGWLLTESMGYMSPLDPKQDPDSLNATHLVQGYIDLQRQWGDWQSKVVLSVGRFTESDKSHLSLQDFRLQNENGYRRSILGRSRQTWNLLDDSEHLGLWQPVFEVDALRPDAAGLTGLFYQNTSGEFETLFFASPLFIPSMGPPIQTKSGKLVSESRWFSSPPDSWPFKNVSTGLVYSLDVPDLKDLVFQPSVGIRSSWRSVNGKSWSNMGFAYKPVNELVLKYRVKLNTPEVDPITGTIAIKPAVAHHALISFEQGYLVTETAQFSFHAMMDSPINTAPEEGWIKQQLESQQIIGAAYEDRWSMPIFKVPFQFRWINYKVFGGKIKDVDSKGVDKGSIFPQRTKFNEVSHWEISHILRWSRSKLETKYSFLREWSQRGSINQLELNYSPHHFWTITAGVDVLGVDDENDGGSESGFIDKFRANDRVYGGIKYVF
jgi:hypothetical protein